MANRLKCVARGVLLGMGLMGVSVANAQTEQTPAGAQEFLAKLAQKGSLGLSVMEKAPPEMWEHQTVENYVKGTFSEKKLFREGAPQPTADILPPFTIDQIDSLDANGKNDACLSVIRRFTLPSFKTYRDEEYFISRFDDPALKFRAPYLINWRNISAVKPHGLSLLLIGNAGGLPLYRITVSDADTLARVQYAFEFLRLHCDDTSGTGF